MNFNAFLEATGLEKTQVQELLRARLLSPLHKDRFDNQDVAMGRVLAQGLSWGYTVQDFAFYVRAGQEIVDQELELRKRLTQKLSMYEDTALTLEMVKNARVARSYILDRLFQHQVAAMKGLKDEGPGASETSGRPDKEEEGS